MPRHSLLFAALLAATMIVANGCRSCSSCHDYDPPVANCRCGHCAQCGCHGAYSTGGCNDGSCTSGGYVDGGEAQSGEAVERTPVEGQAVEPSNQGTPAADPALPPSDDQPQAPQSPGSH